MRVPNTRRHEWKAGSRWKHGLRYWSNKLRFGAVIAEVKSTDGGIASEIEYRNKRGKIIGYWARGNWDPNLPYRG